jgi:hypothetical protein
MTKRDLSPPLLDLNGLILDQGRVEVGLNLLHRVAHERFLDLLRLVARLHASRGREMLGGVELQGGLLDLFRGGTHCPLDILDLLSG